MMRAQGDTSARSGAQCKLIAGALLVLAVVVSLTYRGALENGFHFDDKQNIHQNHSVRIQELSFATLKQATVGSPNARRPLPFATFAVDWWRGGGSPRSFQWTNISLHCIASFAAFGLLLITLSRMRGRVDAGTIAAALGSAALWSLHPIQVQAVSYIVQRMALMAGLFTIVSVFGYVRGRLAVSVPKRFAWFGLCLLSGLLGALSKQNAWITPALLVLAELGVVRNRKPLFRSRFESLVVAAVAAAAMIAIVAAVFGQGPLTHFTSGYADRDFTILDRLRTQPRVVLFHVSQIFLPLPSRFSLEHDFAVSTSLLDPVATLPAILLVLCWVAGGCWLLSRRGRRVVGFWMLWIPATLAIESSIIPLEMIFEHRMYLPSVGIVGLLSLPIAAAFSGVRSFRGVTVGVGLLLALILLSAATTRYLAVWRDPIVLAEHTTRNAPSSARAWSNLARAYLEAGRREAGADALRISMSFAPDDFHNLELMGLLLFDRGQLVEARAHFERALAASPMSSSLLNHLGEVELAEGAHEKAAALFRQAAAIKRWLPSYRWNLALALEGLGRCAEARREWQSYLALSSDTAGKAEVEKHLLEVHSANGRCPSPP